MASSQTSCSTVSSLVVNGKYGGSFRGNMAYNKEKNGDGLFGIPHAIQKYGDSLKSLYDLEVKGTEHYPFVLHGYLKSDPQIELVVVFAGTGRDHCDTCGTHIRDPQEWCPECSGRGEEEVADASMLDSITF